MSIEDYNAAKKLGDHEFRSRMQKKEDPYLPVLDEVIENVEICARVSLGLVTIPLDKIVGTSTKGRTTSFASNFMPILDSESEFAIKWASLADSALEEGIRDPIVVMEYLNHFYVVEGNKRVSVSKYLNAVSIEAMVTRVIPARTDEKENRLYYEFLDFYYVSAVNYLWFTEEGCYAKLLNHLGKNFEDKWTSEEKQEFYAAYAHFSREYKALGGKKMPISTGDAMLRYLDVFGYKGLRTKPASKIKAEIHSMWDEFRLISQGESIGLLMEPIQESGNLFSTMLHSTYSRVKAAFIYNRSPLTSGWTYSHDQGRKYVEGVFGDKIDVTTVENVAAEDAEEVINQLIADGNQVIFTTSPVFVGTILKASVQHPDVKILNCSLLASYKHIRSYYLRTYEAKFILGAIAGAMAENERIGYVSDYPIYGMPASINAFALGAGMVNPYAKIYLEWSTIKDHDALEALREKDVSIVSNRDIHAPYHDSKRFGLYFELDGEPVNLAVPVWHWGKMYEAIIRSVMKGTWKAPESGKGVKALNYWWGMSSDSIGIRCSDDLPENTRRLVDMLTNTIKANRFNPFSGVMYDQKNRLMNRSGEVLSPAEIITMDWLCDNVVGYIPEIDMLRDDARDIVALQGVHEILAPDTSEFVW